jgi:hypothetical protein
MAVKKKRIRDYHEPWSASKSDLWTLGFRTPPKHADSPEELRVVVADWEAARGKAEKNADWIIWGSRLNEPAVVASLLGTHGYADDRRILTFSRMLGLPEGSPDHEEFAKRVVDCVNAMTGIGDPIAFMQELTAFLMDMSKDPIDEVFHGRATRLWFKIADHKEFTDKHAEDSDDPE